MPCEFVKFPDGTTAIVCGPRAGRARCQVPQCGQDSVALCDYPVQRKGKLTTRDMKLCSGHAKQAPDADKDYCPAHANLSEGPSPALALPARPLPIGRGIGGRSD